jgi:prevent-host-death family protein
MGKSVSAAAAKTRFGECLREVERGNDVVITRYGRPVAVLVSHEELEQLRRLRASSPQAGLAGLVGAFPEDGDDVADVLDEIVEARGEASPVVPGDVEPGPKTTG